MCRQEVWLFTFHQPSAFADRRWRCYNLLDGDLLVSVRERVVSVTQDDKMNESLNCLQQEADHQMARTFHHNV